MHILESLDRFEMMPMNRPQLRSKDKGHTKRHLLPIGFY